MDSAKNGGWKKGGLNVCKQLGCHGNTSSGKVKTVLKRAKKLWYPLLDTNRQTRERSDMYATEE